MLLLNPFNDMDPERKCQIQLPNNQQLEVTIQPKQLGRDLLEIACKELQLKETTYFGLICSDHVDIWVQDDKRISESLADLKYSKTDVINLSLSIKFFEDSITVLKHTTTVEMFFIHALQQVYKGNIEIPTELGFELAALALQATFGSYISDEVTLSNINPFPAIAQSLTDHVNWEIEVIERYKHQSKLTRGESVMSYMSKLEQLPHYGMHYFKVRDKAREFWWLGISSKGIFQYDFHDRTNPKLALYWRTLENLYFREKKFSVEVCSNHRRAHSSGLTQTANKKKNCKTHNWYGSSTLIKSIWVMAISQHRFYTEKRKSSKNRGRPPNVISNIANALTSNPNSLVDGLKEKSATMGRNKTINNNNVNPSKPGRDRIHPEYIALEENMLEDLKLRKTGLEDQLYNKVQELMKICTKEAELIGHYPKEYVRYLLPNEKLPPLRRRVVTEYKIKTKKGSQPKLQQPVLPPRQYDLDPIMSQERELEILEDEFATLQQITKASLKLSEEPGIRRRLKKQRTESYNKSLHKLQVLENRINDMRILQGQQPMKRASQFLLSNGDDADEGSAIFELSSEKSLSSEGNTLDDERSYSSSGDALSTHSTPAAILNRIEPQSADVDLSDLRRAHTPPAINSSHWSDGNSPPKNKQHLLWRNPEDSYKLKSGSGHSLNSHASSSPQQPQQRPTKPRNWIQSKWEPPKHNKHGWAVSSLDSFELDSLSINSRKSGPSDSSPVVESKPFTSDEQAKYEADKKSSSGQSLTDSGHVSPSHHASSQPVTDNQMPREISDSSLSQISSQSNPVEPPSLPKFYPQSLKTPATARGAERTIHEDEVYQNNDAPHLRKRSSSFSENDHHTAQQTSHRHLHHKLTRSKTSDYSNALPPAAGKQNKYERDFTQRTHSGRFPRQYNKRLQTSNSANDMPTPPFATNDNIRTKYLSRSQGQMNDVSTTATVTTTSNTNVPSQVKVAQSASPNLPIPPHRTHSQVRSELQGNFSMNNSNNNYASDPRQTNTNKYKPYGAYGMVQKTFNIPDDDNYNDDSTKNYAVEEDNDIVPPLYNEDSVRLTNLKRDELNNEVYKEIKGLGWVPSLHEYSSRASVAESMNAKNKKEDIRELLQMHVSTRYPPGHTRSRDAATRKQQAQLLAELRKHESNNKNEKQEKTWESYKRERYNNTSREKYWEMDKRRINGDATTKERTNIFMHKPPPDVKPVQQYQSIVPGYVDPAYKQPPSDGTSLLYNTTTSYPHEDQRQPHSSGPPNSFHFATMPKKNFPNSRTNKTPAISEQSRSFPQTEYYYSLPRSKRKPAARPSPPMHGNPRLDRMHSPNSYNDASVGNYYNAHSGHPPSAVVQQVGRFYTVKDSNISSYPSKQFGTPPTNKPSPNELVPPTPTTDKMAKDSVDGSPVVVQSLATSSDGKKLSVFSITKSAPNTPSMKRRTASDNTVTHLSSDGEDNKNDLSFQEIITALKTKSNNNSPQSSPRKSYESTTLGRQRKSRHKASSNIIERKNKPPPKIHVTEATPVSKTSASAQENKSLFVPLKDESKPNSVSKHKKSVGRALSSPFGSHDSLDELDKPLDRSGPKLTPNPAAKVPPTTISPNSRHKMPKKNKLPASENKPLQVRTAGSPSPSRDRLSPRSVSKEHNAKKSLEQQFKAQAMRNLMNSSNVKSSSETNMVKYPNQSKLPNTDKTRRKNMNTTHPDKFVDPNIVVKPYRYISNKSSVRKNDANIKSSSHANIGGTVPRTPKRERTVRRSESSNGLLDAQTAPVTMRNKSSNTRSTMQNQPAENEKKYRRRSFLGLNTSSFRFPQKNQILSFVTRNKSNSASPSKPAGSKLKRKSQSFNVQRPDTGSSLSDNLKSLAESIKRDAIVDKPKAPLAHRRSLSENFKAINEVNPYSPHQEHYRQYSGDNGHYSQSIGTTRRTASADDLLWDNNGYQDTVVNDNYHRNANNPYEGTLV